MQKITLKQSPDGYSKFLLMHAPNDGNCFYHALATALQNGKNMQSLRKIVTAHLVRNAHNRTLRQAARRASQNKNWAETEEVSAAAEAFQRHILVFETMLNMWTSFGDEQKKPIYLLNTYNVHFEPLIPWFLDKKA